MSQGNVLPSVEDLPPWLRYLAVAFVQRHLFWSDIKLVIETQLDGAKSGDFPGRPGWMYTKNEYATWVHSKEAGVRFVFQPDSFWEKLDILGQVELYGTKDSAEVPWTVAMRKGRVWLPEFGLAKAAMNDLVTLGFLEKDEYCFWVSGAGQDFADGLGLKAEEWSSKILDAGDKTSRESLELKWKDWIAEVALDPKRADLSMITSVLSDEQLCDTIHTRMALGDESMSAVFDAAYERDLPLDPAKLESFLDALKGSYTRVVCGPAGYALRRGILKEKALGLLVDFAQHSTAESSGYMPDLIPDAMVEMLEDATREIEGLADAALLLIEHATEHSQVAIRRALRYDQTGLIPLSLRLGVIGQDWATQEIVAAIPNVSAEYGGQLLSILEVCGHEEHARVAEGLVAPAYPGLDMLPELSGHLEQMSRVLKDALQAGVQAPEITEWAARIRAKLPADFSFENVISEPHQSKH